MTRRSRSGVGAASNRASSLASTAASAAASGRADLFSELGAGRLGQGCLGRRHLGRRCLGGGRSLRRGLGWAAAVLAVPGGSLGSGLGGAGAACGTTSSLGFGHEGGGLSRRRRSRIGSGSDSRAGQPPLRLMSSPRGPTARCGRRDAGPSCAVLARTKRVRRQPLRECAAVFASAAKQTGWRATSRCRAAPEPLRSTRDDGERDSAALGVDRALMLRRDSQGPTSRLTISACAFHVAGSHARSSPTGADANARPTAPAALRRGRRPRRRRAAAVHPAAVPDRRHRQRHLGAPGAAGEGPRRPRRGGPRPAAPHLRRRLDPGDAERRGGGFAVRLPAGPARRHAGARPRPCRCSPRRRASCRSPWRCCCSGPGWGRWTAS